MGISSALLKSLLLLHFKRSNCSEFKSIFFDRNFSQKFIQKCNKKNVNGLKLSKENLGKKLNFWSFAPFSLMSRLWTRISVSFTEWKTVLAGIEDSFSWKKNVSTPKNAINFSLICGHDGLKQRIFLFFFAHLLKKCVLLWTRKLF